MFAALSSHSITSEDTYACEIFDCWLKLVAHLSLGQTMPYALAFLSPVQFTSGVASLMTTIICTWCPLILFFVCTVSCESVFTALKIAHALCMIDCYMAKGIQLYVHVA